MVLFGLGTPEILVIIVAGLAVFFFGKKTIMGWIRSGKEVSNELKGTTVPPQQIPQQPIQPPQVQQEPITKQEPIQAQ